MWLTLILSIVPMVAIVLLFGWWWSTDNWDWASAELKPPRTVPQEPKDREISEREWRDMSMPTEERFWGLEQRVTALEERTERQANLIERLFLDKWQTATPSRATESHIKGDPLGVERDSTTLPTLRFSPSDPPIIKGGHAERLSEFVEPEDVLT